MVTLSRPFGVFVDLGEPPTGFVDLLLLPHAHDQWPAVGTVTEFEVLQHRHDQVRLWPLDPAFRSNTASVGMPEAEWRDAKDRHPVGSEVTAEVMQVFTSNHEYTVRFDGIWSVLVWTGPAPIIGTVAQYVVDRHLDATFGIQLRKL